MANIIKFEVPENIDRYFKYKVWRKAFEIYRNNQIVSVRATNQNEIYAQVQGTALYTVHIKKESGKLIMECNCPYWDNCKHEAAVLLYLRDYPEVEVTDEKIAKELSELDEFKLFLSSVHYELETEEYRHDNEAYDWAVKDCVDYIENCFADEKSKMEMLFLLMHHFCLNRSVWLCLLNRYQVDREVCENTIYANCSQDEFLFSEVCSLGDFLENEMEEKYYRRIISDIMYMLDCNQIIIFKEYMRRHEKAWNVVKSLFEE